MSYAKLANDVLLIMAAPLQIICHDYPIIRDLFRESLTRANRLNCDVDGWVRIGDEKEKKIMDDNDWFEIQELVQKITLLNRGLVSEEFAQRIKESLQELTDSEDTADLLMDYSLQYSRD